MKTGIQQPIAFGRALYFPYINFRDIGWLKAAALYYTWQKNYRELDENKNGQPEENFELSIPVARRGFEPRQTEPKSVVLPLYYRAISIFLRRRRPGLPTHLQKGVQK
jgi:hypothetical protein